MVGKNNEQTKRGFFSQELDETKSFKLHLCRLPKTWFFNVFCRHLFRGLPILRTEAGVIRCHALFCGYLSMAQKM